MRQRAEIFVNEKFVKCQLAHQIPFDVDISEHVNFGEKNKVAIRITDPNGNFSWGDFMHEHWGKYLWTASHGFGGILGEVNVEILPKLHVGDIFIKNKPSLFGVDADIEVENKGEDFAVLNVSFEISANSSSDVIIAMFGENEARVVDVSTDAMPLASFSVVNFSPHRLGLKIAKKAVVLKPFEVRTVKLQSDRKLCSSRVAFFNLKDISNPKPIEEKSYSFYSTERVIMFMFKQGESSDAPIFAPYNPRQKRGNTAVGASETIVITNTGPR